MTRLTINDITAIAEKLDAYDAELIAKTGCTLAGIACRAAGVAEAAIKEATGEIWIGVVPITFGQGIITGFCETVASIVSHLGCQAFVTRQADVAGWAEAIEKKADILMFADDERFVAIDIVHRRVVDNAMATAKGFVAGLGLMASGLKQKNVLVLGCGPVGQSAAQALVKWGSIVAIYDINLLSCEELAISIKKRLNTEINIEKNLDQALENHQFIIDATPAADIIRKHHISEQTHISAPGVPLGLDEKAQVKISNRVLHDPLQIGVATMMTFALKPYLED